MVASSFFSQNQKERWHDKSHRNAGRAPKARQVSAFAWIMTRRGSGMTNIHEAVQAAPKLCLRVKLISYNPLPVFCGKDDNDPAKWKHAAVRREKDRARLKNVRAVDWQGEKWVMYGNVWRLGNKYFNRNEYLNPVKKVNYFQFGE